MLHFIACKGDKRHTQLRRYASQAEHQAKPHRREAQGCGGQDSGDGRHRRKDGGLFGVLALDGFLGLGRASYGILQQFQRVGGLCSRNGFPRGTNAVWRGLVVGKNVC